MHGIHVNPKTETTIDKPETSPIRAGEELNLETLSLYLQDKIEGGGELTIEQFPGGHSNLTYLLRTPVREYVLRRGPLGPVAPKAHDMAREYGVLSILHSLFRPAPRAYHLCQDTSIIGAVFVIMERRHGIVIRDHIPAQLAAFPDYPRRVSKGFVNCLVELHSIDIGKHGLIQLGKPEGFLERQVRGWFDRWQRAKTQESADMDRLIVWLTDHLPKSPEPTIVHNDFKLDNVMLNLEDPGRVEAVLDWEMATVGDPLADLGLILCYWAQPSSPGSTTPAITSEPGWYTRHELVERYAKMTGRDVSRISYYEIFAIFKLAVVVQQIYYRFYRGQTQDERFRHFDQRVHNLIRQATALI